VFDDPVEALAALTTGAEPAGRYPAPFVVALLTTGAAGLLATLPAGGARPLALGAVALATFGAALALACAARVARRSEGQEDVEEGHSPATGIEPPGNPFAASTPACCAVPLAAAAGWAALPFPLGAAHLLLALVAAGVAAAVGQVALRTVAPSLIAVVVVTVLAGAATAVVLGSGVDVPAVAAFTAAVALAAAPLLPRAVLRLAGLPRPVVPADAAGLVAADHGPDLLPVPELAARAHLARGQLAGLSGGCAVTAAVAAPVAAAQTGWAGPTLAGVTVVVLLLRVRSFADPATARVHLIAGSGAAVALVGVASAAVGPAGRLGGALALLSAAAAATGALGRTHPVASPVVRRALDLCEGVLTAGVVPLALAATGLFGWVRSR
jgi:type VII secretion integral membrane protein EccD